MASAMLTMSTCHQYLETKWMIAKKQKKLNARLTSHARYATTVTVSERM